MQLHFKLKTAHDKSVFISKQMYHAFSEHILEQKASNEGKRMTLSCSFGMNNLPYVCLEGVKNTHIDEPMLTHG